MDPMTSATLAATLVPMVSGAAGEAGKAAWASLAGFVRQRFSRDKALVVDLDELAQRPGQTDVAQRLAASLVSAAGQDPAVDAWLRDWYSHAATTITSNTANTINGTVNGPVVQAQQVGDITFG
jgi:hypothetical protein